MDRRDWRVPFSMALALAACLCFALVPAQPVRAQEAELSVVAQTSYVAPDGVFSMELAWSGPIEESYSIVFTVLGRVSTSEELSGRGGEVLNRWPMDEPLLLSALGRSASGNLVAHLPIRSTSPGDPLRVRIPDAGVYPVVAEIRGPEGPIASAATQLIRLPTEAAEADLLPVSLILAVGQNDGVSAADAVELAEAHPEVPLTILLDQASLAGMLDDPAEAARLSIALAGRPVIAVPQLDLDPSALAEIGQQALYQPMLDKTATELRSLGLTPASEFLPFEGGLTTDGAQLLLESGVNAVIESPRIGGQGRGRIITDVGSLFVLPTDLAFTAELRQNDLAVARAHRLLASLAIRVETDTTPVVLGGPGSGPLSPAALEVLLGGFEEVGLMRAVPLAAKLAGTDALRPEERSDQDLRPLVDDVGAVLDELETYRGFYVVGGRAPEALRYDVIAALTRNLDPGRRRAALAQVSAELADAFDDVQLPEFQSVTLAAQHSVIPLAIHNDATGSRNVLLRFESDKIDVPDNGTVVEVAPGPSSLDIEVDARSVGLSPLEVTLLTPDGKHELARARFQVRSTAVPGLGLLLSAAGLGMLLLWWARSILHDRRDKARLELDQEREESTSGGSAPASTTEENAPVEAATGRSG